MVGCANDRRSQDISAGKWAARLSLLQGVFYLATGVWPLRSPLGRGIQFLDPLRGGEVGFDGFDINTESAKVLRRLVNRRLVGGDQQVEAIFGATFGSS